MIWGIIIVVLGVAVWKLLPDSDKYISYFYRDLMERQERKDRN